MPRMPRSFYTSKLQLIFISLRSHAKEKKNEKTKGKGAAQRSPCNALVLPASKSSRATVYQNSKATFAILPLVPSKTY